MEPHDTDLAELAFLDQQLTAILAEQAAERTQASEEFLRRKGLEEDPLAIQERLAAELRLRAR
jgi:hypothetical protein